MNASELMANAETILKTRSYMDQEELRDELATFFKRNKCRYIASGAFGSVYEHLDADKVIKISTSKDAYYMYARWCMLPEQKQNPHVPRIFEEYAVTTKSGISVFIHVLERLVRPENTRSNYDGTPDEPRHCPDIILGTLWAVGHSIVRPCRWERGGFNEKYPTSLSFKKRILEVARDRYSNDDYNYPHKLSYKDMVRYSTFVNTMWVLFNEFGDIASLDFHGGNIMVRKGNNYARRKTGTLVITDPVAAIYDEFRLEQTKPSSYHNINFTTTAQLQGNLQHNHIVDLPAYIPPVNVEYKVAECKIVARKVSIKSLYHVV